MKTDEEILGIWDALEDMNEDKSTEFLIAMTCDVAKVSYERVITALANRAEQELN